MTTLELGKSAIRSLGKGNFGSAIGFCFIFSFSLSKDVLMLIFEWLKTLIICPLNKKPFGLTTFLVFPIVSFMLSFDLFNTKLPLIEFLKLILVMVAFWLAFRIPIILMKGGNVGDYFLNLIDSNKIAGNLSSNDAEWFRINGNRLLKLKDAIYEIYSINGLYIKGNTEGNTKYILLSGSPKIINFKNNEIELKYMLPNGLPFTKLDNDNIKQSLLQVFQKYFPMIGELKLSIKGDIMTIRSVRLGGEADFSKNYNFPSLFTDTEYSKLGNPLDFKIGINENGDTQIYNLAELPHILVASETGGGKSVAMTNILVSLMKNKVEGAPIDFYIIDPKKVEFSQYDKLQGFTVETDPERGLILLNLLVDEMMKAYELLKDNGVKNIESLRKKGISLNYKVIIIDEFADIMLDKSINSEFDRLVQRLTALGRAAGFHLIIATQNPIAEVITSNIKGNLPAKLGLRTSDQTKSRTIIDSGELATIKEKGECYFRTSSGLNHIKTFFINENDLEDFIKKYKADVAIRNLNGLENEDNTMKIQVQDKWDHLFNKMIEQKGFKIAWYSDLEFTQKEMKSLSKIFQDLQIIQKNSDNSLQLISNIEEFRKDGKKMQLNKQLESVLN